MAVSATDIKLENLAYCSYVDDQGIIDPQLEKKIGVYAIFDQEKNLKYVGYSRNLLLSLKQHLVRQINECYWYKYYIIDRPNRTILEEIRQNWLTETNLNGQINQEQENLWTQPINIQQSLSKTEQEEYNNSDEIGKSKLLKKVARQVEAEIKNNLVQRNINMEFRFNPKLKEQGLLDLK